LYGNVSKIIFDSVTCTTTTLTISAKLNLTCDFQNLVLCVKTFPSLEFRLLPKREDLVVDKVDESEVLVEEAAVIFDASLKVGGAHVLAALSLQPVRRVRQPASSIGSAQKRSSVS